MEKKAKSVRYDFVDLEENKVKHEVAQVAYDDWLAALEEEEDNRHWTDYDTD